VGLEWDVSNLRTILFAAAVFTAGYETVNIQFVKEVLPLAALGVTQYL